MWNYLSYQLEAANHSSPDRRSIGAMNVYMAIAIQESMNVPQTQNAFSFVDIRGSIEIINIGAAQTNAPISSKVKKERL